MTKKLILILFLLILAPVSVLAWDDCPHGEVDCSYPGECSRYIDTDNDGMCDHSQLAPEKRINNEAQEQPEKQNTSNLSKDKQSGRAYHLFSITLTLIFFYLLSHILSKKKIISVANHRKIWNILLLVTFLISGLLGIILIIKINYSLVFSLPFNDLFWHVEAGIAMFVISIFHCLWHWPYFKNIFKLKKLT